MALFFPSAHAQIDWSRGFEFLDKELQKITADAAVGRRIVDKLVKVWLKSGEEVWALVHLETRLGKLAERRRENVRQTSVCRRFPQVVSCRSLRQTEVCRTPQPQFRINFPSRVEIQGQRETGFEWRLYVYNFRIHDRFGAPVSTFVVLTDDDESWRPTEYRSGLLGTEVRFGYSMAKLLDYRERLAELEQSENPFAVVIQAHLAALETRGAERDRLEQKLSLTKRLYNRGFSKQVVVGLFRFLDWVLWLPEDLGAEFDDKMGEYEEERKMEYVTSTERRGIRKGSAEIVLLLLHRRFGELGDDIQARISALPVEWLRELSVALLDFSTLSDLEDWLQQHPLPSVVSGAGENGAMHEPGA